MRPITFPVTNHDLHPNLVPVAYTIAGVPGIRIEQTSESSFGVFSSSRSCLNIDGEWEYEPMPSARDHGFLKRCRFHSLSEALSVVAEHLNRMHVVAPSGELQP